MKNRSFSFLAASACFCILTIVMFGDVLFLSKTAMLSHHDCDLHAVFLAWREFGFQQLRQGNLALWNPHIFSGTPSLGQFQSALLYPLNFVYLLLPIQKAVNIDIALHIFLSGIFMYLWTSYRKLHPLACFLSSVLFMFCGAHFLRIYAGHITILCALIWIPLILLAVDGALRQPSLHWYLLGIFAVTMQILAGYPQQVFYTAIIVSAYILLRIASEKRSLGTLVIIMGSIYGGAFLMGACQILTGLSMASESVRAQGLGYELAKIFSFPPENLLTFLVPFFFGNNTSVTYWGRGYLWENTIFLSVTGILLAVHGVITGERATRRCLMPIIFLSLVLAFGAHTPLFKFLYAAVPGFGLFRGSAKFILLTSIFIILLAGIGLNNIIRSKRVSLPIIYVTLFVGLCLTAFGFFLHRSPAMGIPAEVWQKIMHFILSTGESYLKTPYYSDASFMQQAACLASQSVFIAAGTSFVLALLFMVRKFSHNVAYVIVLVAVIEIFCFAKTTRATFSYDPSELQKTKAFKMPSEGNYRILDYNIVTPNEAMALEMYNMWGEEPLILKRYAEFMAFTQGKDLDTPHQTLTFHTAHRLFKMLRCRYIFSYDKRVIQRINVENHLPELLFIDDWVLISARDKILQRMNDASFDPTSLVILENTPHPLPEKSTAERTARITDSSTDHLTIEAKLAHPAILLITNIYSNGWRVRPLQRNIQKEYKLLPANYILQAIPLSAGNHRFRVEYEPFAFRIGKWISLVSVLIYCCFLGWGSKLRLKVHPVR